MTKSKATPGPMEAAARAQAAWAEDCARNPPFSASPRYGLLRTQGEKPFLELATHNTNAGMTMARRYARFEFDHGTMEIYFPFPIKKDEVPFLKEYIDLWFKMLERTATESGIEEIRMEDLKIDLNQGPGEINAIPWRERRT